MKSEEALQAFGKCLETLDRSKSIAENFRNFLDFALWVFNPIKDDKAYKDVMHLDKGYDPNKAQDMLKLLHYWSIASDYDGAGFYDALGDTFMEYISSGKNGQFFTPQPICDMMAMLVHAEDIKDNTRVSDPSCGSGRMLLAAGKINRHAKFYGADLDLICCKMTVLNMLLNSMCGEVAWMDTIRGEHYRSWHLKKILDEKTNHYIPYFYVTENKQSSFFMQNLEAMADEAKARKHKETVFRGQDVPEAAATTNQLILF